MTGRIRNLLGRAAGLAILAAAVLSPKTARADVELANQDGWSVFINGRMQAFANYNRGGGYPQNVTDANGNFVRLQSGGYDKAEFREFAKVHADNDPGTYEDLRIRTGFTGNVLGFGIKRQLNANTEVLGYTAVTTYIESQERRKYLAIYPDWRQSFLRVTGPWGSFTGGRDLCPFGRGGTEITFLYGFKYGLGYPGSINREGPTAGHVGFGVLGNGFCSGLSYATPSLAGAQLTAGVYDALVIPGGQLWERTKWPRLEGELTYETKLGTLGMFKVFANGMWQKIYEREGYRNATMAGIGYGGRVEVGPVHLGLAGHYGKGVGLNFALDPSEVFFHPNLPERPFRFMDGYYAQLQVAAHKTLDLSAGAGVSEVQLLKEDAIAYDPDGNPLPAGSSVGYVPVHRQLGISGGVTHHVSDNLHVQLEYFRAMFTWYKPSPSAAGATEPHQTFDIVNAGVTYDF